MALTVGTRLGPYEINALIGQGGMGEVYRARDGTLNRDVALKVLPESFARDPDRLGRFKREAHTLASLNHPNIAAIYGFEESNDTPALVLELVDGPTLADRIAHGAIPIADALSIARQITEALNAAHEYGVVHRDLKPANIKVRPDGTVKVLDFGLAKIIEGERVGAAAAASQSPTITNPAMTLAGVVLGTPAYMSPEQARGQAADRRSDVWAFGCVLYEMLTGRPTFPGESISDIVARVIEREPDWSRLPVGVPARVRELLRHCLEKDPKKRRRDIGDVRLEIERAMSEPAQASIADGPSRSHMRLAWIVAALLAAALAVTIAWPYIVPSTAGRETRVDVSTPDSPNPFGFALSPDGRRLVFEAYRGKQPQLFLRSLNEDTAQPLSNTNGARLPFWSPDGRSIGFFQDSQLKRLDLDGGLVTTLAKAEPGQGGTWGPNGMILFAPTQTGQVFRMPASGGEPVAVTQLDKGHTSHRFPALLPDGHAFLFYVLGTRDVRGIYLASLDSTDTTRLTDADTAGEYLTPGWLLFARQGALLAHRFDLSRRVLSGDPVTVAESVAVSVVPLGAFSVSATGTVAYRSGEGKPSQLTWFDRAGNVVGTLGEADRSGLMNVALSRDGRRAAVERSPQTNTDIWVIEADRMPRVTSDSDASARFPLWSPEGDRIAFNSRGGTGIIYVKASSGSDELVASSSKVRILCDWSRDGRFILYFEIDPIRGAGADLWAIPMSASLADRKPSRVLSTGFRNAWGQFSPDGRWIAYQSDESQRFEIYVSPFPGSSRKSLVSTSGGAYPRWSPDGRELYYFDPDGTLMAVSIAVTGDSLDVGKPVSLFQPRIVGGGASQPGYRQQYDVAPNGRFLINVTLDSVPEPIRLILNWDPSRKAN